MRRNCVREKLVELQDESDICPEGITSCIGCKYYKQYAFGNPCDVRLAIADRMIAHGVTVQQWIPVREMLPEEMRAVIVWTKDGARGEAWLAEDGFEWCDSGEHADVTHWMPFPDPPKGE